MDKIKNAVDNAKNIIDDTKEEIDKRVDEGKGFVKKYRYFFIAGAFILGAIVGKLA